MRRANGARRGAELQMVIVSERERERVGEIEFVGIDVELTTYAVGKRGRELGGRDDDETKCKVNASSLANFAFIKARARTFMKCLRIRASCNLDVI